MTAHRNYRDIHFRPQSMQIKVIKIKLLKINITILLKVFQTQTSYELEPYFDATATNWFRFRYDNVRNTDMYKFYSNSNYDDLHTYTFTCHISYRIYAKPGL